MAGEPEETIIVCATCKREIDRVRPPISARPQPIYGVCVECRSQSPGKRGTSYDDGE